MFLVMIKYIKPLDVVDQFVAAHRAYLDEQYAKNCFIVSGPRNPREGGVMLSQLTSRDDLLTIIKNDPYTLNQVAEYEIIEFNPVKFHPEFSHFLVS